MKFRKLILTFLVIFLTASCLNLNEYYLERKIRRVESGLLAEDAASSRDRMDLLNRMAFYQVPGFSIAVINEYQIEWAKGYGVMEAGNNQPVTPETLFPTGSTAKPIVAAAALHLVEEGLLELDRDVNDYLIGWKVPETHLTALEKVTLRRLLSHQAGLDYIPLFGYAQGKPLPSLEQILNGLPPADSDPVLVLAPPGSQYSYSNGGYLIVEQLLVDMSGKPFDRILDEIVISPLQLKNIVVSYPLSDSRVPNAASGHLEDGAVLPGKWHTFPEMGPGGSWWATPSDLARFYIELMLAYRGHSETILSQEMVSEMLTPQIQDRGLGPWIGDDGGNRFYFGHPGHNYGYKCYTVFYPERGQGLVMMTNSENGDLLYREILNSVNNEYGWLRDYTVTFTIIAGCIILAGVALFLRHKWLTNSK